MRLKYIISEHGNYLIFSEIYPHNHVARAMHDTAVGAGFCDIQREADSASRVSVHCWGESVSLGIKSREEDEKIISEDMN